MHNFLVNLLIGIIGGIFSSIIVSRIFLIRQEFQNQLDILRMNSYCLGGIFVFFDVLEIVLKNSYDTAIEIQKNPDYVLTHNLKDSEPMIAALRKEILIKNIDTIDQNNNIVTIKEKKLYELHKDTIQTIKEFKDLKDYKFDTIDTCKKQLNALNSRYQKCFKSQSTTYFSLIIKDKVMIILYIIFIIICILAFLSK